MRRIVMGEVAVGKVDGGSAELVGALELICVIGSAETRVFREVQLVVRIRPALVELECPVPDDTVICMLRICVLCQNRILFCAEYCLLSAKRAPRNLVQGLVQVIKRVDICQISGDGARLRSDGAWETSFPTDIACRTTPVCHGQGELCARLRALAS
eukprot:3185573-Rhodomonas_salina.2